MADSNSACGAISHYSEMLQPCNILPHDTMEIERNNRNNGGHDECPNNNIFETSSDTNECRTFGVSSSSSTPSYDESFLEAKTPTDMRKGSGENTDDTSGEQKTSNDEIFTNFALPRASPRETFGSPEKSPKYLKSPKLEKSPKSGKSPRSERSSPRASPKSIPSPKFDKSPKSDKSPKWESPKSEYSPRPECSPKSEKSLKSDKRGEQKLTETEEDDSTLKMKGNNSDDDILEDHKNGTIKKIKYKSENRSKVPYSLSSEPNKKKLNSSSRGRPAKRKALVTTYHSQISGDKNGIKICIKKSNLVTQVPTKKSRKRKQKVELSDSDGSEYEIPITTVKSSKKAKVQITKSRAPKVDKQVVIEQYPDSSTEQTPWGLNIPTTILEQIFRYICYDEGCLPILVRLQKVCRLWRSVAITPSLWKNVELSSWIKERQNTDLKLQYIIESRLSKCQDLNLSKHKTIHSILQPAQDGKRGNWKVNNISYILDILATNCLELHGLNLSGWIGLSADHVKYISSNFKKLERLDLSYINPETYSTKCGIGGTSLVQFAQDTGDRLTHLLLANNKLAGLTQILNAISTHCPNLQLLDLSNIRTLNSSAPLNIEVLQNGCPKLKVLRITNSQITLANTSLKEQVASPGFPLLEELSVAAVNDSRDMGDDSIERILKTSHKLRLLDVRGCARISDSSLVRVPAWDLEHLFLSGCFVTRLNGSGLELIAQKWSHSLIEIDLAWSTATEALDAAVMALAEKAEESKLKILNLCGSSVSLDPVKAVLKKCPLLQSINLSSCRALPRGIKRLYEGVEVAELKTNLEEKPKQPTPKHESESAEEMDQSQDSTQDSIENEQSRAKVGLDSPAEDRYVSE